MSGLAVQPISTMEAVVASLRARILDGEIEPGIRLTEREGPVHDPNTFETNVPGLFVAGGAIAGIDTGTIFIENGRFHGEKIVEEIARRI